MHKRPIFASRTERPLQSYPRLPSEVAAIETDAPALPPIDVHDADVSRYMKSVSRQTRLQRWLGPATCGLLVLDAGIVWIRHGFHPAGIALGVFYIIGAVIFLAGSARYWRTSLKPVENLDGATLTVNADGIASDRLASFLSWRVVARAVDLGDAIAIVPRNRPALVIPKAALPDGGTALWSFLYERLVGKRMLQRSRSATILNTADASVLA